MPTTCESSGHIGACRLQTHYQTGKIGKITTKFVCVSVCVVRTTLTVAKQLERLLGGEESLRLCQISRYAGRWDDALPLFAAP